jgi:cytoskeletal protein CcmA (bactofilin family)
MFRPKDSANDTGWKDTPLTPSETQRGTGPTQVSAGAFIHGDLKTPGPVAIDGGVEGTLCAAGDIQIGTGGAIVGDVEGKNITVAGKVHGRIFAEDRVILLPGSRVEGDIHAKSLKIEDSVFFQGGCVMGEGARNRHASDAASIFDSDCESKAA